MKNFSYFVSILSDGLKKKKIIVEVPLNSYILNILWVLYKYGFINGYSIFTKKIEVQLKYVAEQNVIATIKQISRISKRIYQSHKKLTTHFFLTEGKLISNSKGIQLINKQLRLKRNRHGGELLIKIN